MTAFVGGAIFVAEVCALSVVPRFEVAVLNRKLVAAESASSWSTGYVLTFENVSNAQWIGSKVGLSPPNIGLLAEPKKAESVTPEKTVRRGGPRDAASSASETSTRIRDTSMNKNL